MGVEPTGSTRTGCSRATDRSPAVLSIQMVGESIESRVEERLELVDPAQDLLQWLRMKLVDPLPSFASLGDQSGISEDLEMLRNGRERNPEGFGQLSSRLFSFFEQHQNRPARRMSDRVEHVVLLQGSHTSLGPGRILAEQLGEPTRPVRQRFFVQLSFQPVEECVGSRQEPWSALLREPSIGDRQ